MDRLGFIVVSCAAIACGPGASSGSGGGSADGSGSGETGSSTGGSSTGGSTSTADASSGSTSPIPDVPDVDCETTVESDLPGVTIDIVSDCAMTLAAAREGVETQVIVTIAEALEGVDSGTACHSTPRGGVHFGWSVSGGDFHHCRCDVGLCPEPTPMPTTLVTGETTEVIEWAAYSWNGPSDYGADYGDPFTAGEYTIEVTASGFFTAADGTEMTPFTIVATRPVVLVE